MTYIINMECAHNPIWSLPYTTEHQWGLSPVIEKQLKDQRMLCNHMVISEGGEDDRSWFFGEDKEQRKCIHKLWMYCFLLNKSMVCVEISLY